MCFSAAASFVVAGVAGGAGVACLMRAKRPQDLPLAAAPVVFAVHQGVEGLQWLVMGDAPDGTGSGVLTLIFVLIAKAFWPIYAPFAVWISEPQERRRLFMTPWLAVGLGVGAHLLFDVLHRPHTAVVRDGHIAYLSDYRLSAVVALGYLGATTVPLILSSQRPLALLGVAVLVACAVTHAFFQGAVLSIWCFFAAAASVLILLRFWPPQRRSVAGPTASA